MIKVEWSPQICIMYKKTNINKIDSKLPLAKRITTFDGKEQFVLAESILSSAVSSDIENTVLNIVKHIQDVSEGNTVVRKLHLFFKIDKNNRLWILHCSRIEIRNESGSHREIAVTHKRSSSVKMLFYKHPDHEQRDQITEKMRINHGQMKSKIDKDHNYCINCLSILILTYLDKCTIYEVKMLHIFNWKNNGNAPSNQDLKDEELLELLNRLLGKENMKRLNILIEDKNWLNHKVPVCDKCYLNITKM